ncbi:hypothetical protein BV898_09429 [Hypsibius exemplaris]|uniref:Thyroglobulin type-1 domain-containing protein n=1 Tax=Hypsibius exemplaris TaxID=2072580 RepID=A0A1W0WML2_HYPEX|nr:hypothetical protein BV898_09429 [Hypsibius exemplaris]
MLAIAVFVIFSCGLAFGQDVPDLDTRCPNMAKFAAATKAGSFGSSKPMKVNSPVGSLGRHGGAGVVTVETPSKTIWMPQCSPDSQSTDYLSIQVRQNNERFCVLENSGMIIFDPARTAPKGSDLSGPMYCQCNRSKLKNFGGLVGRPIVGPVCDPVTGAFNAVQQYTDGACFCQSKDGTITSQAFSCNLKKNARPCTADGKIVGLLN